MSDYIIQGAIACTPDPFIPLTVVRLQRNNAMGRIELLATDDGGKTYTMLLPQPGPANKSGAVLTLDSQQNAVWLPPAVSTAATKSTASTTTTSGTWYIDVPYFGTLVTSQIFGYFKTQGTALTILGTQITIQNPGQGSSVVVDIVDANSLVNLNRPSTVSDGQSVSQTLFSQPLSIAPSTGIKLKITQVGSTFAGDSMNVRLILS